MSKYKHIRSKNVIIKIKKKKRIRPLRRPKWFQNKRGIWLLNGKESKIYKKVRIPSKSRNSKKLGKLKRTNWGNKVTKYVLQNKWNQFYKFPCAYAILYVTSRRRNTFIVVAIKKQPKAIISAGILNYKGRKKISPFVKERLGTQIGIFCRKNNIKLLDLTLTKKARRSYKPILKGIARSAKAAIRGMLVKKLKGHGYVRPMKARRI